MVHVVFDTEPLPEVTQESEPIANAAPPPNPEPYDFDSLRTKFSA